MGRYLNTDICFKNYTKLYNTSYFVDKSTIIEDLNSRIGINNEFKFLKDRKFEKYFGFTEEEVKLLCTKSKNTSFKEIDECYDSYLSNTNIKLYDPHSVIFALENN